MKNLIDYIIESNKIQDPELAHEDGSKERVAYDISGYGWIVGAYCYADGGAPTGCDSLESLLKKYDTTGALKETLSNKYKMKDAGIVNNTLIVGAWPEEDDNKPENDRELLAWVWGKNGICYENKKK